jgi:hypothetical protein
MLMKMPNTHLHTHRPCVALLPSGVPNSGKSEWIDALTMNLAMNSGMAFAMCSLEKTPDKHAVQVSGCCTPPAES